MLVAEDDIALEDVYEPRIPKNFEEVYTDMLHLHPSGPHYRLAKTTKGKLKLILEQESLSHLLDDYGLAEIDSRGPSPARIFVIVIKEKYLEQWTKIDVLVRPFVAEMFPKDVALTLSPASCPQFQLPIRYYFENFIGY